MCSLANKLTFLRIQRNLTKKEIAEAVGVHPSSIGNLEKGSIPQADLLLLLAHFFNVSMEYLMNDTISVIEFAQLPTANLSSNELSMLNFYSQLHSDDQLEILDIIKLKIRRKTKKTISSNSQSATDNIEIA